MTKQEWRQKMRALRQAADPAEAGKCLRLLLALPAFQRAETLFCYASYGSEFPTVEIAAMAEKLGKRVAYPKVLDRERMAFFAEATLAEGFRGIPEPLGGKEVLPAATDLMLLPALAFSLRGDRLGYGGGYYDRYLGALNARPVLCGLGYASQLAKQLPREEFDIPLDLLLTPEGVIYF